MSIETARRVLVTGAGRGIGRAIAEALGKAGFALGLHYRSSAGPAADLQTELAARGTDARLLGFDVADADQAAKILHADVEEHGAYWGVIANAGITADAPFASMKLEQWQSVLRTNLDGFFHVVQPLVMPMVRLRQGGRIVAISSVSGLTGNRGQANYAASKAGLIGAVKSLAQELGKRAITVNAVAPGFIETDMLAGLELEEIRAKIPLRRLGKPAEVAELVRYLCSDAAAYVTGQTLAIDGGMT
jgi:3-oxoacyl-[acyl-carrier protein] reductase